jgi:hypothetical protein
MSVTAVTESVHSDKVVPILKDERIHRTGDTHGFHAPDHNTVRAIGEHPIIH